MAYISGKKKDIRDLNKNITIGVAFPLNEVNMFKGTTTTHQQTKANLLNLIMTNPGERLNLPDYGIGMKNLLFEQEIDEEIIQNKLKEKIRRYLPLVSIQSVIVDFEEDKHTINVYIDYIYHMDGSLNSIKLNFK